MRAHQCKELGQENVRLKRRVAELLQMGADAASRHQRWREFFLFASCQRRAGQN